MKAIQFDRYGGPEVLQRVELEMPRPAGRQVLVKVHAIGVNYADTARREGQYVVPTPLPFVPGAEIAGTVIEVGPDVQRATVGMPVVALIESGGYAEYALVDEFALIPIPPEMEFAAAAALPLQGLSAYHVLKTTGGLKPGESVLVHAGAGGVGLLSVQLAKLLGAGLVIATASTDDKLQLARSGGADVLVNYTQAGWEKQVLEATEGQGVDVALEMVGGDVFDKTLTCLARFGRIVVYGMASGQPYSFSPIALMRKNQSVTGFFLPNILMDRELVQSSLVELFHFVHSGKMMLTIGGTYPLEEAAEAHRLLQSRQTTGKLILLP